MWKLRQQKKALQAERGRTEVAMVDERGPEPPVGYGHKHHLDGTPRSEMAGGYEYRYGYGNSLAMLELPATPGRS
jgi:hypothetical protein